MYAAGAPGPAQACALLVPSALALLTTTFTEPNDGAKASWAAKT
jgi:hypothetical protein